ncbi:MAG: hypothetical protein RLZZ352_26 [Pseudomonadota bacterium]|jgi:hypothetical protein
MHRLLRLQQAAHSPLARARALLGTLSLALALSACGGSEPATPAETPAAWSLQPVTDAALVERWQVALNPQNSAKSLLLSTEAVAAPGTVADAAMAVSGTVLQEAGVDEADRVKSDGVSVFSIWPGSASDPEAIERYELSADPSNPSLKPPERLTSPLRNGAAVQGLYLDTERAQLVALGERGLHEAVAERWFKPLSWLGGGTELAVIDTANTLRLRYTLSLNAQLVGSRRVGGTLYLVLRSRAQPSGFDAAWSTAVQTENQQQLLNLKAADVLPTVSVNGEAAQPLLAPDSCLAAVKPAEASADVISLVALNLSGSVPQWSARCFAGNTETFYLSDNNLYLATSRWTYTPGASADAVVYPVDMATDIHQFALDGSGFKYQGSGTVPGHLGFDQNRKPWRLSEHQGVLRVATETAERWGGPVIGLPVITSAATTAASAETSSPVRLTLLKPDASQALTVVGSLPNAQRPAPLGKPGEQLYASRFVGNRAYLVTYRLTDPLYVLDLSDPSDPRTLGELEVSGYSDYLFPLSERYLLGIGKEAAESGDNAGDGRFAWYQGVKLSLIDVADPTKPQEVAKQLIGQRGTDATVLHDHHGVALLPLAPSTGGSASVVRVALPIKLHDTAPADTSSPSTYYHFTRTQLSRLEVNLDSGTLTALPALSADGDQERDISHDRAVLTPTQAHHYQNGRWASWVWE